MRIILGNHAGFCFGVKNAINLAKEAQKREGCKVFTFGPLVHNAQVLKDLEKDNIYSKDKLPKNLTLISRAHGISEKEKEEIKKRGNKFFDATCPFVKKIHEIVKEETTKNKEIIIFGDKNHPELKAIIKDFPQIKVTRKVEEINLDVEKEVCLLSQTTENKKDFEKFKKQISDRLKKIEIKNTICEATELRQKECEEIAKKTEKMIVIGGKNSNNSRKLFEIAEKYTDSIFVQDESEINLDDFKNKNSVGITAGASTPPETINKVFALIKSLN